MERELKFLGEELEDPGRPFVVILGGAKIQGKIDTVENLLPHLTGQNAAPPHDALYWRWAAQSAIRASNWKLLRGGDREYLYDLDTDLEEKHNLAAKHPEIASRLTGAQNISPMGEGDRHRRNGHPVACDDAGKQQR